MAKQKKKDAPGVSLEKIVRRIQQMMEPKSRVTHDEKLNDRVGIMRQYDVVIRGQFGGQPVLGVIEVKDHSRKKGPDAIEAFAKKTENLGANLKLMVSRKGFTKNALKLAKFEHIGCLSLLPEDPQQAGFSIGDWWYGVIRLWTNVRLKVYFSGKPVPIAAFSSNTVKWQGKPVINWFLKDLYTNQADVSEEKKYISTLTFKQDRNIEIEGQEYLVKGIACIANRIYKKKRKWVSWSGDAFFDWHTGKLTVPSKGELVGSAVESDLSEWPDFDGEIPTVESNQKPGFFIRATLYNTQTWDSSKDDEVPGLGNL